MRDEDNENKEENNEDSASVTLPMKVFHRKVCQMTVYLWTPKALELR